MEAKGAVADEPDAAVEALEAAVGQAEADGGEDAVAVRFEGAGEADEWAQARARGPREPGIEVGGRELLKIPFAWPAKSPQTARVQGERELGAVALGVKP